jgi:hypothetical protein
LGAQADSNGVINELIYPLVEYEKLHLNKSTFLSRFQAETCSTYRF